MSIHQTIHKLSATGASTENDPLAQFDFDAARHEGWTIVNCGFYSDGAPHIEMRRLTGAPGAAPKFKEDRDVWEHVVRQARACSMLHYEALALVDRREQRCIESLFGAW